LRWPSLEVQGDRLRGGPVEGVLSLGGDRRLQLQLRSQPPTGTFERITVPGLELDVDGQVGSSAVKGQARATWVLAPSPLAAALDAMVLRLRVTDPAMPALQLALDGEAQVKPGTAIGRVKGTINDQPVDARVEVRLGQSRPYVDLQASFGTLEPNRFLAPDAYGGASAPVAGSVSVAASARVDLQPLSWVDGRLRLDVARLLLPPYRVDGLELQASLDNGMLDVQRLAGRAWDGSFEASGNADARNGHVALRLRAVDVDLHAMLAQTAGYEELSGRGRVDAELQTQGGTARALRAALAGHIALSLQPAAIRGVDLTQTLSGWRTASEQGSDKVATDAQRQTGFSRLDCSFDVRDGVARSTDLDGSSEFLRVGGEGSIDIGKGRLDYVLRARVVDTASGRAGPELVLLNGVTVPVELSGPFGHVDWQVRWAAVTAAVVAHSAPNVVRGTVGGVARGAAGVVRGAAGAITPASR